ncbi:MAG: histidine kinase [Rubrivivax sp. SCN 71-131]|nr:MAG: histidine kinase [Rubrivivax sp. SCN 71-131]
MNPAPTPKTPRAELWQRLYATLLRAFHGYATWLVGISWKRFILLSIGLLVIASIAEGLPPFTWRVTKTIEGGAPKASKKGETAPPAASTPAEPAIRIERPGGAGTEGLDISIDASGIRIKSRPKPAAGSAPSPASASASAPTPASAPAAAASTASAPAQDPAAASAASAVALDSGAVDIRLPAGVDREAVRTAVEEAREAIEEAIAEQREAERDARTAEREARAAEREAREAEREARDSAAADSTGAGRIKRIRRVQWGDFLGDLALLWIIASAIIKASYKGRLQAEVQAAQATETAEAESLKRQLAEARMAAMQAQIEPHFLFNTLASIDHLIETDPGRASRMQKNLIALLRASMPDLRESAANGGSGARDLGRELQVIRPYLEILKVRMEERLQTRICVPSGLLSAQFPSMMLQTLVENAIKHGLEPKAEGGRLEVCAEIVDGRLHVSVADTGLGFGRGTTAGTGVGLANIRERLRLLHGDQATLTVTENPGGGTLATIAVPYRSVAAEAAQDAAPGATGAAAPDHPDSA